MCSKHWTKRLRTASVYSLQTVLHKRRLESGSEQNCRRSSAFATIRFTALTTESVTSRMSVGSVCAQRGSWWITQWDVRTLSFYAAGHFMIICQIICAAAPVTVDIDLLVSILFLVRNSYVEELTTAPRVCPLIGIKIHRFFMITNAILYIHKYSLSTNFYTNRLCQQCTQRSPRLAREYKNVPKIHEHTVRLGIKPTSPSLLAWESNLHHLTVLLEINVHRLRR